MSSTRADRTASPAIYLVPAATGVIAIVGLIVDGSFEFEDGWGAVLIVGVSFLGSMIQRHQPKNRIGALLQVAAGLMLVTSLGATAFGDGSSADQALREILGGLGESLGVLAFLTIFVILFIFPDGRFLNRRWRRIFTIFAVVLTVVLLVSVFSAELGDVWNDEPHVSNPIGFIPWEWNVLVAESSAFVMLALAISGVVAISLRYRGSGEIVRTQIKWVVYAAIVMLLCFPIAVGDDPLLSPLSWGVFFGAMPAAIAVSITRFRLYEIDRLISRTIAYAIVVGLVVGTFFGLVIGITSLLPTQGNLAVAGSTLAAAALFNPLRRRVQALVDRRFNRTSYEARLVAEDLASRLREPHTADEVASMLNATVEGILQPAASGVWVNVPDGE